MIVWVLLFIIEFISGIYDNWCIYVEIVGFGFLYLILNSVCEFIFRFGFGGTCFKGIFLFFSNLRYM